MHKSIPCCILALALSFAVRAQYWQQQVNYTIDVSLNDREHSLDGYEKIAYTNHSPDTLRFIWFHVWPNAFKNDKTAFSEQLLINGRTDFYFSNKEQRGYINRLDFKVNGVTAETADHPQYIDIIQLLLPQPLAPGSQVIIATPFHVQLPENFSRGGHTGQSYQVTQWFPKPAVYDRNGWHPMPYLDQGEFYSEFGNYDVRITLPDNYVVAATGKLQDESEKAWLKKRNNFNWEPVTSKTIVKKGSYKHIKKTVQLYPYSAAGTKTLQFIQDHVHDFAWFADKRFIVQQDTLQLASGKIIEAYSYYLPGKKTAWTNSMAYIKNAIRFRSALIGEYPFNTVSAVEAKMGVSGGMEYPTITSISPGSSPSELADVIEHEVGHNWLQGILATNERAYPWMDEGINTYYDNRYAAGQPTATPKDGHSFMQLPAEETLEALGLQSLVAIYQDQPINTPSENFTELNYGLVAYHKTGKWMALLEKELGRTVFDSCMHVYYQRWQFKHPYPEDFIAVVNEVSGRNNAAFFSLADKKGVLPPPVKRILQPVPGLFKLAGTDKHRYINFFPALGYNSYDKAMVGALIHNYGFPENKFRFLAAPLYGTGSKRLNYLGRISYTWYPHKLFYKTEIGLSTASFSMDAFQPDNGQQKIIPAFRKIAPFVRFTLPQADPLSQQHAYVQFTPFFINENGLNFKTVINGADTSEVVEKTSANRYLTQLKLVLENNRILYPYRAQLQLEQADGFIRAAFTGNYYFNYANNKSGLTARLFAGKFFYTGARTITKQFETDRYQLNMTGANGYEDYTYSNYFIGRNEFDGTGNRQIMMRDGGFKVRTDLLSSKIGKTDNWLGAVNLVSDIADKAFPVKIFADIGTYADAWQNNPPTARFLYDAGLQLSLFYNTLNIYLPLLYSHEYRDYFRSTLGSGYLFKTISFSIDIQQFSLRKINRNLDF